MESRLSWLRTRVNDVLERAMDTSIRHRNIIQTIIVILIIIDLAS